MKELFLEALSGMNTLGKVGLISITAIAAIAVFASTILMIVAYKDEIKHMLLVWAWHFCINLCDWEERLTQFNEKNDAELKACSERWWDECKALKTQMPKISEVIGYQLRGAIR